MDAALPDRYEIVGSLGAGGTATVYRARDRTTARDVAIKVVRSNASAFVQRMLREARAVAALDHPNIVRLYDVLDDPPALVMEFVDGTCFDRALAGRPLRDRLAALECVARAVHAAHQRGIVHRDLKPANIVVDAGGRVVLMDFGLAQLESAQTHLTRTGVAVGTPLYMAPEQIRGTVADARVDVWSLSVLLYELLAGRTPFHAATIAAVYDRILRSEPPAFGRSVARDLETICRRALDKDPWRRYPTAAELADDLARYLAGEAILARPPSVAHRLRAWVARRKIVVAAALAGAVALGAALAVSLPALQAAHRQVRSAEAREAETRLYVTLEKELDLLREKFYRSTFTLDSEMQRRYEQLVERIEAQMRATGRSPQGCYLIGRCREVTAEFDRADAAYGRALDLDSRHVPSLLSRGRLRISRALAERAVQGVSEGRAAQAREKARAAVDLVRRGLEASGSKRTLELELAEAYLRLIETWGTGQRVASGPFLERWKDEPFVEEFLIVEGLSVRGGELESLATLAIQRAPSWPDAYLWRGAARQARGDTASALGDFTEVLRINPRHTPALLQRGMARQDGGDFDGAHADFSEVLRIEPTSVAALVNRGYARAAKGEPDAAIADYTEALRIEPECVDALNNRGNARAGKGELDAAVEDFTNALRIDPRCFRALLNRGNVRRAGGDIQAAIADYTEALRIDPRYVEALNNRGNAHTARRDFDAAIADYTEALRIRPAYANALVNRGLARAEQGDLRAAIEDYTAALRLAPGFLRALEERGAALGTLGEARAAASDYEEALRAAPRDWPQRATVEERLHRLRRP